MALPLSSPARTPLVASASLDNTWEYAIDNDDAPECTYNTVTLIKAIVQTSRLASARASPNPLVGVQVIGTFSALVNVRNVFPVFEASAAPHPQPAANF